MAACNDNWAKGGKAGRVITAALVATLSVGAPVVALATTADASGDISLMFASPEGAFSDATITGANFYHADSTKVFKKNADGVWQAEYDRNQPVLLADVTLHMFTGDGAYADFKIDARNDDYKVEYFARDAKTGEATGEALTGDIVDAGNYIAKVTAVSGDYKGGAVYVPFDITPIDISKITLDGELDSTYDAEAKEIAFSLGPDQLYVNTDIDVTWYRTGNDLSDDYKVSEVKDAGTYRAYIEGKGNYTGSVDLNGQIVKVDALNLDNVNPDNQIYIPAVYSDSASEPTVPGDIMIDGTWYAADSAIAKELKAELKPGTQVWNDNDMYHYEVTEAKSTDNITGAYQMNAVKVGQLVSWGYQGGALADSYEIVASKDPNGFNDNDIVATDAKGNEYPVTRTAIYDSLGVNCDGTAWWNVAGTYTCVYRVNPGADFSVGGQKIVTVTVYADEINADATAAVSFDGKIVSSVETTYDGTDVAKKIKVTVQDKDGKPVNYNVSYFDADGNQVSQMINAGTYTLKVETPGYKLTGTTEMTVKINPVTIGEVTSDKLETAKFDWAGVADYDYLPWTKNGYAVKPTGTLTGLGLYWLGEDDKPVWLVSDSLVNDVIKVTILDSEGNEVEKIVDEGLYTIKFEARNDDAKVNYVMPADLEVLCAKDYTNIDEGVFDHTLYSDVRYDAYYADAAAFLNSIGVMRGYEDANGHSTGRFGSADTLTRGQVAVILYNMASHSDFVGTMPEYDPNQGYVTGFDDTDGFAYYAKAVAWCKQSGLIEGYVADNTFRPDQNITREEFATMLCNYEKAYGDYKAADESVIDKFADAGETSDWAVDDIAWAVEQGILLGNPSNELNPTDSILRAETAVMVYRYLG